MENKLGLLLDHRNQTCLYNGKNAFLNLLDGNSVPDAWEERRRDRDVRRADWLQGSSKPVGA
jgi:hypothetical protein